MTKLTLALALVLTSSSVAQQSATTTQAPAPSQNPVAKSASQDPSTVKARAMLDKMIAALGGQAYLTYSTMTQQGRSYSFYQGRPNSVGAPFWRFWQYPNKDRVELTKQRDVVYIYNGDDGYEVTYKGTANMDRKDLDNYLRGRHYGMDNVIRVWMKDPATLIYYEGTALADQSLVEQVTLVNKENEAVTIGIDPNTNLPLKKSYTYRDPFDGLKSTDEEIYANYRPIQGIQTALSIVRYHNGLQSAQRFLNKVEYNVPLQESMFDAKVTYDQYKLQDKKK